MHRPDAPSPSKLWVGGLVAGLVAPTAWLLTGCSPHGGDLISSVALPSEQAAWATEGDAFDVASPPGPDQLGKPDLTPAQRTYLDALLAAGVRPSNELRALRIGAYVCQARAAGHSDQAVWDSVAPMVRSDISDTRGQEAPDVQYVDVDLTIGHYIGLATQKLC